MITTLGRRLEPYGGRPTLVAVATMNAITGIVAAAILAPLSAGADVDTYRRGAEGIADGVYAYGFLYSPIAGIVATPLTWVTLPAAAMVMSTIGIAVLLVGVRLDTRGRSLLDRALIVVAALTFLPVMYELLIGQVTLLLAAAVYPSRDRDGFARGIPLGLALALVPKPMLLPVIVWMLVRRRRSLVAAAVTAAAVTIVGIMGMGAEVYRAWLTALTGTGEITRQGNLALTALGSSAPVLVLIVITALVTLLIVLRDERGGFVAALLAGLLVTPFTLMYMVSILLLVVRPALDLAPRATRALALVANPVMFIAFIPWAVVGLLACAAAHAPRRGPARGA